jgi:protein-disulfide isomerase
MRRSLPVFIILVVAIVTAATAVWFYRAKMNPAAPKPAPALATETPTTSTATVPPANASSTIPPDIAAPAEPAAAAGHARGVANAPVTMEVYGDFQCPSCAKTTAVIDDLEKTYGSRLRVVFHEFPLAMHAHALEAAMAAEAAGAQGRFWEMHDMLYKFQDVWSKASNPGRFFGTYAESLGLNAEQFQADLTSPEIKSRIMAEGDAGVQRGVRNTPTIFINGQQLRGAFSPDSLRAALDEAVGVKKGS